MKPDPDFRPTGGLRRFPIPKDSLQNSRQPVCRNQRGIPE
jgi:hypothetical protein